MILVEYRMSELIKEISMGPFGSNIKAECYMETGVPYLNGGNVRAFELIEDSFHFVSEEKADSLGRAVATRGDVIVTHRGTIGQIAYIPDSSKYPRYLTGNSQFRFTCNEKVLPEYIVYYFHTPLGQHELLSNASQVGVPALARPTTSFQKLTVFIPDIESQKKIIGVLLSIEEKIKTNNRINENLLQQASTIYQAWFEDFVPFDGICPADWKKGVLSDIANITSGKRPPMKSTEKTSIATIPLVGAASVMGFTCDTNHTEKILVTGRVGTHGVIQRFNTPCWTSDNTLVITSDLYEYTYQILQRIDYHAMNRGSTQPLITQGDMNKVVILIPDRQTINNFEELVGLLMRQHEENLLENAKLVELRDALLPRLMSGELDVSDIDL